MTSTVIRKLCARCSNGRGVATCNGCQQMFCVNHFSEHREELSKLMDNISEEHDCLRGDVCQENLKHPLLSRVNQWEHESIVKIQTAAQTARTKLQEIFDGKKDKIKVSIECLANELQASRESADYTEIDINKWTEKLKTLRETLADWSAISIEDDNHTESVIHLIKISDQQSLPTNQSSDQSVQISEKSSFYSNEKFDKVDVEVVLSEEDLVATCHSKLIFYNRFVYGVNRYSSGKHSIQFCIEKMGEALLFFGIITSSKKYDQSYFNPNNSSVYGWHNLESFIRSGKSQKYTEENILTTGDTLTLILDCDNQQIFLQHPRTNRLFQIPVELNKCPFPWKIIVGLSHCNDCIRIVH